MESFCSLIPFLSLFAPTLAVFVSTIIQNHKLEAIHEAAKKIDRLEAEILANKDRIRDLLAGRK
jgi:hypothetical protein